MNAVGSLKFSTQNMVPILCDGNYIELSKTSVD